MDTKIKWKAKKNSEKFDKIINVDSTFEILPLTHKITCFEAINVLQSDRITPVDCDVFDGKKLIYLFYGIPAYEIAQGIGSRKDFSYYPVCFLIKHDNITLGNVFPFDSGAFKEGLYKTYMNDKMQLYDFALKADINYIRNFISTFYDSNEDYYKGKTKNDLSKLEYEPVIDYYIDSYIKMITKTEETKIDARAHTIEIITEDSIPLKENLMAIFAPKDFFRKYTEFKKYCENNIEIIEYNTFNFDTPSSYNAIIKNLVYEFLERKKLL